MDHWRATTKKKKLKLTNVRDSKYCHRADSNLMKCLHELMHNFIGLGF